MTTYLDSSELFFANLRRNAWKNANRFDWPRSELISESFLNTLEANVTPAERPVSNRYT